MFIRMITAFICGTRPSERLDSGTLSKCCSHSLGPSQAGWASRARTLSPAPGVVHWCCSLETEQFVSQGSRFPLCSKPGT